MQRKILGICAALVAFGAFAVMPAIGSAATLTDTVGGVTKIPAAGSKIIGQGVGVSLLKGGLTAECNENVLTGSIHRNSGGVIEGTIEDGWFQSNLIAGDPTTPCRSLGQPAIVRTNLTNSTPAGAPVGTPTHWCVKTLAGTDEWELEPRNCTGANGEFTFTIKVGNLDCGFKRAANIAGTFNTSPTHASTLRLTMTGEPEFQTDKLPEHSGLCPAKGTLANFAFDLYTDTNVTPAANVPHPYPVITTDPLYAS